MLFHKNAKISLNAFQFEEYITIYFYIKQFSSKIKYKYCVLPLLNIKEN